MKKKISHFVVTILALCAFPFFIAYLWHVDRKTKGGSGLVVIE